MSYDYDIGVHDVGDKQVEVMHDELIENPRHEYDHVGKMVCWHRRYNLGDEQPKEDPREYYEREIKPHEEGGVVLPLYLYDHSGITMRTEDFGDPWDSGQVGWVYCTAQQVEEEWNGDEELAEVYLKGEVEEYDQYLRGDVYCVIIFKVIECNLGHLHRDIEDTICGLYGLEQVAQHINSYCDIEEEVA
jgi:hypothetical protein